MKKNLLFTGCLICFLVNAIQVTAQPYQKFLHNNNEWDVFAGIMIVMQNPTPESMQATLSAPILTLQDTVIGSNTYKKTYTWTENSSSFPSKTCFVREDTVTKQVFMLSADSTTERIMYDFSLVTGDSIFLSYRFESSFNQVLKTGWYFVDSTGVVNTISGVRNTWFLSNPSLSSPFPNLPQLTWIEGIGSTISPLYLDESSDFSFLNINPDFQYTIALTCVFQDGIPVFHDSAWASIYSSGNFAFIGDSCIFNLAGGIHEYDRMNQSLIMKPNPMISSSVISLNHQGASENSQYQLCMYDVTGRMIDSYSVKGNELLDGFEWKPLNVSPGFVFVALYCDGRLVAAGKLMNE